jgi:hypothetical protein
MTEAFPPLENAAASQVLAGAPDGRSTRVSKLEPLHHPERPVPAQAGALSYPGGAAGDRSSASANRSKG